MTTTLPASPAPSPLEAMWATDGGQKHSSLAFDIALACRALMGLPPEQHAPWGERAAALLIEADRPINPFAPRDSQAWADPATSSSNSRHDLVGSLARALAEHGSLDAVEKALDALPPAIGDSLGTHPMTSARAIFSSSFARFCEAGRFEAIARACARGAKLSLRFQLPALIDHRGSSLNTPGVLEAAKAALMERKNEEIGERKKSSSTRSFVEILDAEILGCDHPAWLQALSELVLDPGRPGVDQLGLLVQRAHRTSCQDEEWARAHRARLEELNHRHARVATISIVPPDRRRAAKAVHQFFADQWIPTLSALAQAEPASAARALIDWTAARDYWRAWQACGLSTVDAVDFLCRPSDSFRFQKQSGSWPIHSPREETIAALKGLRLTAMDCFALSGKAREAVAAVAQSGAPFGEDFSAALSCPGLGRPMSIEESLWLGSLIANPMPGGSKGPLRI